MRVHGDFQWIKVGAASRGTQRAPLLRCRACQPVRDEPAPAEGGFASWMTLSRAGTKIAVRRPFILAGNCFGRRRCVESKWRDTSGPVKTESTMVTFVPVWTFTLPRSKRLCEAASREGFATEEFISRVCARSRHALHQRRATPRALRSRFVSHAQRFQVCGPC